MIEVSNLTFNYSGSKHKVFSDFSLQLANNRIYGLLGKNGTGKSTLLYLIAGLLKPKNGSVKVNGYITKNRDPEFLQDIYIVPEEYDLPNMSLESYIKIHQDFYPKFDKEVLNNCLKDFDITGEINFKQLSMGQKKKVYMSFALASCCSLLLMDEPTNGLDIPSKASFRKVIAGNLSDDSSLIISTHQVHDIEQLLDHVIIINHSEVSLNAAIDEITQKYSFGYCQPSDMNSNVVYAEPSLQGNAYISIREQGKAETQINLELLFNAVTQGKIK